jgi:hypothetical protein
MVTQAYRVARRLRAAIESRTMRLAAAAMPGQSIAITQNRLASI